MSEADKELMVWTIAFLVFGLGAVVNAFIARTKGGSFEGFISLIVGAILIGLAVPELPALLGGA